MQPDQCGGWSMSALSRDAPGETREIIELLRNTFADDISDVQRLTGGAFSRAFAFTSGGNDYVIRVNSEAHAPGSFAKDDCAGRHFASAALPIPRMLLSGATGDGRAWFSISERAPGRTLAECSADAARAALPSLLETIDAIGRVDLSGSRGFGDWGGDGEGKYESWRGYLTAVNQKEADGYYANWHALFHESFLEREVFDAVYRRMLGLLAACPETRALIHNDLWLDASNVLVDRGRVSGVIDWANALYGDPLYDVARILWGTNWPGWWREDDVAVVRDRFSAALDFETRITCYTCHIGLDDLRYYAKNGRRADYEIAGGLLLALICAR
jgi:hygromycin-B 4-O-kinase